MPEWSNGLDLRSSGFMPAKVRTLSPALENNKPLEIWNKIKESKKILISLHIKPDGDSFGSSFALKYAIEKHLGKKVDLISKDPIEERLKNFDFFKEIIIGNINEINLDDYDLLIFPDSGSLSQFNLPSRPNNFIISIDHHETNEGFGDMNYIIKDSSSCCDVLVDFFKEVGIEFDKEISLRLLIGITTDTGFFAYSNNAYQSFIHSAFLVTNNINYPEEIYNQLNSWSWGTKKLHGLVLSNMKKRDFLGKTIFYSAVSSKEIIEKGISPDEIRSAIFALENIAGADIIFNLLEVDGGIKNSYRSSNLDVSVYAKKLGGGGHKKAASCILKDMDLDQAVEKVFQVIKEEGYTAA